MLGKELEARADSLDPEKYRQLKEHLIALAAVAGIGIVTFTGSYANDKSLGDFRGASLNSAPKVEHVHSYRPSTANTQPVSRVSTGNTSTEQGLNLNQDQKITALMRAIIGQESAGKFNATNRHSGALGYGQVMPENVPSWTQEALGYPLTPTEFLKSPKLQLKTIKFKLAQAIASQTQPGRTQEEIMRRVASIWYSGQAKLWDHTKPQYYDGHRYPSISDYTASVYKRFRSELEAQTNTEATETVAASQSLPAPPPKVKVQAQPNVVAKANSGTSARAQGGIGNLLLNFFTPKKAEATSTTNAQSIVAYMESQGYKLFRNPGEVNIIHVRNGSTASDLFEDKRIVLQFVNGNPVVTGEWAETTKPGLHIVYNPINSGGAIAIKPGQYRAWQVGTHIGGSGRHAHEALIQTGGSIVGYRDSDRNRTFETITRGFFGVNIHEPWSWGKATLVEDRSAGCMVTATKSAHRAFMKLVRSDPRFVADETFIFTATIIDGKNL